MQFKNLGQFIRNSEEDEKHGINFVFFIRNRREEQMKTDWKRKRETEAKKKGTDEWIWKRKRETEERRKEQINGIGRGRGMNRIVIDIFRRRFQDI